MDNSGDLFKSDNFCSAKCFESWKKYRLSVVSSLRFTKEVQRALSYLPLDMCLRTDAESIEIYTILDVVKTRIQYGYQQWPKSRYEIILFSFNGEDRKKFFENSNFNPEEEVSFSSAVLEYFQYGRSTDDELQKRWLKEAEIKLEEYRIDGNISEADEFSEEDEEREMQESIDERHRGENFHALYDIPFDWSAGYKTGDSGIASGKNSITHLYCIEDVDRDDIKRKAGFPVCSGTDLLNRVTDLKFNEVIDYSGVSYYPEVTCKKCIEIMERWK